MVTWTVGSEMRIAQVEHILKSLGAGKFIVQSGAHSFKDSLEDGHLTLCFRIPSTINRHGAMVNTVKVRIVGPLTYAVEFGRFWGDNTYLFVADKSNVHQCDLREVFTEYTGVDIQP